MGGRVATQGLIQLDRLGHSWPDVVQKVQKLLKKPLPSGYD